MILASDYIGFKVVEYLVGRGENTQFLVLDPGDKGGYNKRIEEVYQSSATHGIIADAGKLNDDEFLDRVAATNPCVGILAWWPHILKGRILTIPRRGWLNFHPSYLPYDRGKHPNFWCLVDGTPCGVSLQYIDKGIDTGDIVAQKRLNVSWEDTGETVYHKSRDLIFELFKEKYDEIIAGRLSGIRQDPKSGSFHAANEIDQASRIDIDASYTARKLFNIVRARMFSPHPTSFFYDGNRKYSVQITIKELKDKTGQ